MIKCKVLCNCNNNGKCEVEQYEKCGKYMAYQQGRADEREKVLDTFVKQIKDEMGTCDIGHDCKNCCYHGCIESISLNTINDISKQLKVEING